MRLILTLLCCASLALGGGERPKVRAVTAFINIDPQHYDQQFDDTLKFLDSARKSYAAAGFEVEGVRIATQPFPVYTAGMKPDEALAFLGKIAALAHERHFGLNIGPAMLEDGDDTAPVDLLIRALVAGGVTSSLVIAGDDGIHWRAIGQAARLIKEVGAKSANGVGNFSFAAIAMVKPYGPFFPGAYHVGTGHVFAVAFEGASVGKESGWAYAGIDPTPAPNGSVSIGHAIESFLGAPFGSSGTMTAASIITH